MQEGKEPPVRPVEARVQVVPTGKWMHALVRHDPLEQSRGRMFPRETLETQQTHVEPYAQLAT